MVDAISSMPAMPDMQTLAAPAIAMKLGAGISDAQIDKAAHDFEAMFATQMLQPMFETVQVNDTFGGGHGEEVMRSFLLQEYGKVIAKSGRLGIAPQIKSEMLRAQGRSAEADRARKAPARQAASAVQAYANASMQGEKNVAN